MSLTLSFSVALLCDAKAKFRLKFTTFEPSGQCRAVADGVTNVRCIHSSGELVDELLSHLMVQAVQLLSQRLSVNVRKHSWEAKVVPSVLAAGVWTDHVPFEINVRCWSWCWVK